MMTQYRCISLIVLIAVLCSITLGIDVPAGLRPAKAVGETGRPIVPGSSFSSDDERVVLPQNVRTPPNLTIRSRMIAALNSRGNDPSQGEINTAESTDSEPKSTSNVEKPPVIFQKNNRKNKKSQVGEPVAHQQQLHIVDSSSKPSKQNTARIAIPPPAGKNYGVNTLLQTNLVDSKGRIIKGVNSVPIRVPSSSELRNAKTSRASASQVDTDAEKVVPVQFGRAERHKRTLKSF